jgi:16S rRNA (cytosine1402-N4)-methyltransferase
MMMAVYHEPVLKPQSVEGLNIKPDGTYVDLTFGGGGHTMAILEHLTEGKLFAFDQDEDAEKNAERLLSPNFTFVRANFRHFRKHLKMYGIDKVDGILADLGISSHQIDEPVRGFSTRFDAELDMRMDTSSSLTARKVLKKYSLEDLHKIFGMYGEVKNALSLAKAIVAQRNDKRIKTVNDLRAVALPLAPKGKENKYLAQVFQALRIEVNDELEALREMLLESVKALKENGRLVVISYHSLEDRLVKNFINTGKFRGDVEKDIYGNALKPLTAIQRKALKPDENELAENPRSRSARLRIAERTVYDG